MADRKEYLRNYQRAWVASRRMEFFAGKRCVKCGSSERLELDHIDPYTKAHHAIWSWSRSRMQTELAKCQILCHDCHLKKSVAFSRDYNTGRPNLACRKLSSSQVVAAKEMLLSGASQRLVASFFGVGKTLIQGIHAGTRIAATDDSVAWK